MSRVAYVNGIYQPHGQAVVHIEDRGFQFADGVYEAAIEASRQALDRAPDLALLRYNLGICHLRNAQPGPAVLWLRRALWISPRDPHIRQALAMAEETAGAAGDSSICPW